MARSRCPANLLSESGRAVAAHHQMVVVDIIGLIDTTYARRCGTHGPGAPDHQDLAYTGPHLREEFRGDLPRCHHAEGRAAHPLQPGLPEPEDRAKGETIWEVCRKLSRIPSYKSLKYIPKSSRTSARAWRTSSSPTSACSSPCRTTGPSTSSSCDARAPPEGKAHPSATLCDITCDSDGSGQVHRSE